MGTKEIHIEPGVAFAIRQVIYPRVQEVHDPTTPKGSGTFGMKMGTIGSARMFKELLLNMLPNDYEKRKRAIEYLESYYELRLLSEAGIDQYPYEIGREVNAKEEPVIHEQPLIQLADELETCPLCTIEYQLMSTISDGEVVYDWLQCSNCAYSKLRKRDPVDAKEITKITGTQRWTPTEVKLLIKERVCTKCQRYLPKDDPVLYRWHMDKLYCVTCSAIRS